MNTSPPSSVPKVDFFVIGAARSGTTSVYRALVNNPIVFDPPMKEPRFFRENFEKGWEWYAENYRLAAQDQLCGDFSPSYTIGTTRNPVARKIKLFYPNAKVLYMVRNPIECAISNWRMAAEIAKREIPFAEAMTGEWNVVIIQRVMFHKQLQFYLEEFDASQILVAPLELINRDMVGWMRRIQEHIGVPDDAIMDLTFPKANASARKPQRPKAPPIDRPTRRAFLDEVAADARAMLDFLGVGHELWPMTEKSPAWLKGAD